MKKTIMLLLTSIICAAIFTGCPHETQPEQETDKYERKVIFDKDTFDAQRKAWKDSGIKNYSFSELFVGWPDIFRIVTIKDNTAADVSYYDFDMDENNQPVYADKIENLETAVVKGDTISPETIKDLKEEPVLTISGIYDHIENWYKKALDMDLKEYGIIDYEFLISYDEEYHFPKVYQCRVSYDYDLNDEADTEPYHGKENKIFDFKVLD